LASSHRAQIFEIDKKGRTRQVGHLIRSTHSADFETELQKYIRSEWQSGRFSSLNVAASAKAIEKLRAALVENLGVSTVFTTVDLDRIPESQWVRHLGLEPPPSRHF